MFMSFHIVMIYLLIGIWLIVSFHIIMIYLLSSIWLSSPFIRCGHLYSLSPLQVTTHGHPSVCRHSHIDHLLMAKITFILKRLSFNKPSTNELF